MYIMSKSVAVNNSKVLKLKAKLMFSTHKLIQEMSYTLLPRQNTENYD